MEARLERAARFFGDSSDLASIRKQADDAGVPQDMSIDLPSDAYAIDETLNGDAVRRFPAVNAATTKLAAAALVDNRARYPYAWRKKAATRVLDRAMRFGADLDGDTLECLSKMAGLFPADNVTASRMLALQSERFRGKEAAAMREAAHAIGSCTMPAESCNEFCTLIDKTAALLMPAARPMVEDAMYTVPASKSASAPESLTLMTGNTYDIASLMQAPPDTYRILGDDVAAELLDNSGALDANKMATVLPTLPRPDAAVLDTALSGVSIAPRGDKEAGAHAQRRGAASMFDSLDGWTEFLQNKGSKVHDRYRFSAPLRHDMDVHDFLPVT